VPPAGWEPDRKDSDNSSYAKYHAARQRALIEKAKALHADAKTVVNACQRENVLDALGRVNNYERDRLQSLQGAIDGLIEFIEGLGDHEAYIDPAARDLAVQLAKSASQRASEGPK
jgi:hypothetical protein